MKKGFLGNSNTVLRIFGIDIQIHYSWWFIFALLVYSLSTGYFPYYIKGLAAKDYWIMGSVSSLLLFVSVVMHELSHSLVARWKKIDVKSITLFFFGGVAAIGKEDMKPAVEFQMAVAGPLFSLILAGIFFLLTIYPLGIYYTAIFSYLAQLNLILALFNLLPGYPLDGGRAFRAILNAHYKDIRKSTFIASKGGKIVALALILFGFFGLFSGSGGLWLVLIGGFLYFIAGTSYEQVVIRDSLKHVKVKDILIKDFPSLDKKMNVKEAERCMLKSEAESMLVIDKGNVVGAVSLDLLMRIKDTNVSVDNVMHRSVPSVKISDSGEKVFDKMQKSGMAYIPVISGGKIKGVISRRSIIFRLANSIRYG